MREILFRGFHEDKNGKETIYIDGREIKGEWVEGFLYINSKGEYEISYYSKAFNIERYTYVVIPETVGQFTGLTDKNGKKIFEGDICSKFSNYSGKKIVFPIVFEFGLFYAKYSETAGMPLCDICEKVEIIGNIHDNPELLRSNT